MRSLWRIECDEHERGGKRLLNGDSVVSHIGRKLAFCLGLSQLCKHLVSIRVGLHVEVHNHPHQPVVGVEGIHVVHIVHAAHLLLNGSGDRLFNRQGVSPDISGLHQNLGRDNIGILRYWQPCHRDQSNNNHDDSDYHRYDRASYKEPVHNGYQPTAAGRSSGFAETVGAVEDAGAKGFGFTSIPCFTFCTPSTTTRSPCLRPSSISH